MTWHGVGEWQVRRRKDALDAGVFRFFEWNPLKQSGFNLAFDGLTTPGIRRQ